MPFSFSFLLILTVSHQEISLRPHTEATSSPRFRPFTGPNHTTHSQDVCSGDSLHRQGGRKTSARSPPFDRSICEKMRGKQQADKHRRPPCPSTTRCPHHTFIATSESGSCGIACRLWTPTEPLQAIDNDTRRTTTCICPNPVRSPVPDARLALQPPYQPHFHIGSSGANLSIRGRQTR